MIAILRGNVDASNTTRKIFVFLYCRLFLRVKWQMELNVMGQ